MKKIYKTNLKLFLFLFLSINTGICSAQFSFVHISDIHVADGLSAGGYDVDGAIFEQVLTTINNLVPKPAFVVASGDISNAGNSWPTSMYSALTQHLYPAQLTYPLPGEYFINPELSIPIYFVPGNHDYRTGNIPPLSSTALTSYAMYISTDTDYSVNVINALLLFVRSGYDDNRPIWEDTNPMNPEGSGLTDSQCAWIRNTLQSNPSQKKIIIMHHPPVDAVGTNWDGTPFTQGVNDTADGSIKYNRTVFLNICDSNNVDIVLAGHEHQDVVADRAGNVIGENYTWSGTRYVQTGSTLNGSYRIITVNSDSVYVGLPQISVSAVISEHNNDNINIQTFYDPDYKKLVVSCDNIKNENNTEIGLYNTLGQKFFTKRFGNNKDIIIETGNLSKGIYLLTLRNGKEIITKKINIY